MLLYMNQSAIEIARRVASSVETEFQAVLFQQYVKASYMRPLAAVRLLVASDAIRIGLDVQVAIDGVQLDPEKLPKFNG